MPCTVYSNALFSDLLKDDLSRPRSHNRSASVRGAAGNERSARGSPDLDRATSHMGRSASGQLSRQGSKSLSGSSSAYNMKTMRSKGGGVSKAQLQQEAKKVARNKAYWMEQERLQAESEREVREKLDRAAARKESQFQRLYSQLTEGHEFMDSIENMLMLQEQMEHRKQTSRFNEWHEKVFDPIQEKISTTIKSRDQRKVAEARRREYEKFLDSTNKKSSLFLDIVIESEYDPFVPNRNCIKYNVSTKDDPTKRVLTRHKEEQSMVPSSESRGADEKKGNTRDTLDVLMWGTGKIECTPHGHFAKMLQGTSDAKKLATYKTNFALNHFEFPTGKECVSAELPKGKRTDFSQWGINPKR